MHSYHEAHHNGKKSSYNTREGYRLKTPVSTKIVVTARILYIRGRRRRHRSGGMIISPGGWVTHNTGSTLGDIA